jgi:hypothetical protein
MSLVFGIIVVAGFAAGVGASALASWGSRPAHGRRRRPRRRPEGYRAPALTPEDQAASPVSAELLDKVLHAVDAGADPYAVDVAPQDKRMKLAIAFMVAAIHAVHARNSTAKWTTGLACAGLLLGVFVPVPMGFMIWIASFVALLVAASLFAAVWSSRASLSGLAASDEPPAAVAANLRRIAGWPEAQGHPLVGWPAGD